MRTGKNVGLASVACGKDKGREVKQESRNGKILWKKAPWFEKFQISVSTHV